MVTDRRGAFVARLARASALLAAALVVSPASADEAKAIRLSDATQRGVFNVGASSGDVAVVPDAEAGGDVVRLTYAVPPGTAVGVWAKGFPPGFAAGSLDVVSTSARSATGGVTATLEIKGSAGVQRIPLEAGAAGAPKEHFLDWHAIGTPTEVVVSVAPAGGTETVRGTLALDIRFESLAPLRRLSLSPAARFGGVALAALVAAALAGIARAATSWPGRDGPVAPKTSNGLTGWPRDLANAVGAVGLVGLALAIDHVGGLDPLEIGWWPAWLALAGVALGAWWTFALTGRMVSPGEALQDALATGLLAASVAPIAILQALAHWSDLFLVSQPVAAALVVLYHGLNVARLGSGGRRVGPVGAAMIVGVPYAVGWLLLLEPGTLVRSLGEGLGGGLLADRPEVAAFVGRAFVLFVFNEIVAAALGMATRRSVLTSPGAHAVLFAVAVAAVAGPWVAWAGSGDAVASWPGAARWLALVVSGMLSQAGLWAEAYLLTGLVLDAIRGAAPTAVSVVAHPWLGLRKGMVYSGTFLGALGIVGLAVADDRLRSWAAANPLAAGILVGAIAFPLVKAIIETFDGSQAFFRRVATSYRKPMLYARGAVIGLGLGSALASGMSGASMGDRVGFGFLVGAAAYAGVNFLGDLLSGSMQRGRVQSWRVYLVQGLLGGAIGAALGFYLDAAQLGVIVAKFHRYVDPGQAATLFEVRPLLSQWGLIRLGDVGGGSSLLYAEALAGVISWAIPSWLFAINRTFMTAYFDRDAAPIRSFFTRAGLVQLGESMIGVLRWGLWMSPIINSFLRPMGDPTWYNQDGAIHTVVAIGRDLTSTPSGFREWSLNVFIALLAYDWVRILIWVDHMGLRVATLVNLSFLGMDRLDRRLARFLAPASTARCIPEAVKRFTTWAPLLIPFYIPRGRDWDAAWAQGQALRAGVRVGPLASLLSLPLAGRLAILGGALVVATAAFSGARALRARAASRRHRVLILESPAYELSIRDDGAVASLVKGRGFDVTRRSYDLLDPAGRALFVVEGDDEMTRRSRAILGNVGGASPRIERDEARLRIIDEADGLRVTVTIALPDPGDAAEVWTVAVENATDAGRRIRVVPYVEWVLNRADADRGHTQYNRLFAEIAYEAGLHAVLAWDKHAKAMGVLAADVAPEGFLSARVDFLGRARSLGSPRVLETLAFFEARDTDGHPTFDPIGSLLLGVNVPARGSAEVRLLIGQAADKAGAIDLVARHLALPLAKAVPATFRRKALHPIGHGEIPPGTPPVYAEFSDDGRRMLVRTPNTPRPFDHTMANALGHVVTVTNRGLHTTSSVNAQQNRVTPDWSDTVTREVPGEAIYLYEPDAGAWFSPTYHPRNDPDASYEAEFSVDGTATFRMAKDWLATELTVFVPPDEPAGIYRLMLRNESDIPRRLRVAPYFQIVLAGQPEFSGPLRSRFESSVRGVTFRNPRNTFRTGPAFAVMSGEGTVVETSRGHFFGEGHPLDRPHLVATGEAAPSPVRDDRPVAAFLAEVEIPAGGERTVVVVLGQADDRGRALEVMRTYRDPAAADRALERTRRWWSGLMETVTVETGGAEFDRYLPWLRYQALAERIWARRGFYQASGAFGFRDQLQDSVNLLWMDPVLARRQILLHSAQQFLEGDVVHWFHRLQDGRTGFVGRTHASDNLLWLPWAVVEYLAATGDDSLLDERTPYLESDLPFEPLPAGKGGMGFDPLRSSREESVYLHCLRAIDLVLDRRMGAHGLPLMGTGDWNDGLDEIGSEGRGESVWLGFFLHYILERMLPVIGARDGGLRDHYEERLRNLAAAIESTWRGDRYLRAFHDDGTEIGVKGSGVWEIDALTAAWAVMSGINPERGRIVFHTALATLERDTTILLGWPPLREDTHPYLGRSSIYPEGVRENGMYCHGVQWLVGAARILAEQAERAGRPDDARGYRETAYRLWLKTSAIPHAVPGEIETYGGQPNQQAADMVTTFEPGRMIWNGYTGAAGWMFRQAIESVLGLRLDAGRIIAPGDSATPSELGAARVVRDVSRSPFEAPGRLRPPAQSVAPEPAGRTS